MFKWWKFYDQGDALGSAEDMSAEDLERSEAEFEKEFTGGSGG